MIKNLKILLKRNLKNENFRFILSFFILQFLAIPFIYFYKIEFDNVSYPLIESIILAFMPIFIVVGAVFCLCLALFPILLFVLLEEIYNKIEKSL